MNTILLIAAQEGAAHASEFISVPGAMMNENPYAKRHMKFIHHEA